MEFTGLSAFVPTPFNVDGIVESEFEKIVARVAESGVNSICALGSTGGYAYLNREERALSARLTIQNAGSVPVMIGISALSTRDVLNYAEYAQNAGAASVMLAPVTYQLLTDDEVFGLYADVVKNLSVPLVVYDNPLTTHIKFTDELIGRISELPGVVSFKTLLGTNDPIEAKTRVDKLKNCVPAETTIGVSGDGFGALGLLSGCKVWYSAIAGVLPEQCLAITNAALSGDSNGGFELSKKMDPIWGLFTKYGSYRVIAAIANEIGLISNASLPLPVLPLKNDARLEVKKALQTIGLIA